MFIYLAIIISLTGLLGATYTDLKSRIVPNKLNYGLAIAGLIIFGIQSILESTFLPFFLAFLGMCWGFFFGWILWKIGIFAGGDVKLFMGLGALNPFTPALLNISMFSTGTLFMFPLTLFVYSLIGFLPYGMVFLFFRFLKNKKIQKQVFEEMKEKTILGIHISFYLAGLYTLLAILENMFLIFIIGLIGVIIWGMLKNNKKILTIIMIIAGILFNWFSFFTGLAGALFMIVIVYGIIKFMFSLRPLLSKKISVNKLEEGMIPSKTLAWDNKKVIEVEGISISSIIKYTKEHKIGELFQPKKEIISAVKARGLTLEEIKEVKLLSKKKLISKSIEIKESMPFVPTMLVGYMLALILGDALWLMMVGII